MKIPSTGTARALSFACRRDVLMQLVMHSAYHLGQIAAAVREAGGKPAAADYIVYARQQRKK